jgi:hypothetical protein
MGSPSKTLTDAVVVPSTVTAVTLRGSAGTATASVRTDYDSGTAVGSGG